MEDDVRQSSVDRYAVSQAYRWRAERDKAMQELRQLKRDVEGRLMPDGVKWPRYESGEPVLIGDVVELETGCIPVEAIEFSRGKVCVKDAEDGDWRTSSYAMHPLKRPAPKVLDADGVEIREKRDVWWICEGDERGVHAERLRVETICPNGLIECSPYNGGTWVYLEPSELYANKPVPASDGKPLREGETVWHLQRDGEWTVKEIYRDGTACISDEYNGSLIAHAGDLTHERPDSWERLEEDANLGVNDYRERYGIKRHDGMTWPQLVREDLVRRAKTLAEKEG